VASDANQCDHPNGAVGAVYCRVRVTSCRVQMREEHAAFVAALKSDLGATEFWATVRGTVFSESPGPVVILLLLGAVQSVELAVTSAEAEHALSHLDEWVQPRRVGSPMLSLPASSYMVCHCLLPPTLPLL
jgi:hypothetical protein